MHVVSAPVFTTRIYPDSINLNCPVPPGGHFAEQWGKSDAPQVKEQFQSESQHYKKYKYKIFCKKMFTHISTLSTLTPQGSVASSENGQQGFHSVYEFNLSF